MSQPIGSTAPVSAIAPGSLGLSQALIRGRIVGKPRKFKGQDGVQRFATIVRLPAPDEFTSPATVEVQSSEHLGEAGDSYAGKVQISGSSRPFSYTDKQSGEIKQGTDVTIRLTAL